MNSQLTKQTEQDDWQLRFPQLDFYWISSFRYFDIVFKTFSINSLIFPTNSLTYTTKFTQKWPPSQTELSHILLFSWYGKIVKIVLEKINFNSQQLSIRVNHKLLIFNRVEAFPLFHEKYSTFWSFYRIHMLVIYFCNCCDQRGRILKHLSVYKNNLSFHFSWYSFNCLAPFLFINLLECKKRVIFKFPNLKWTLSQLNN